MLIVSSLPRASEMVRLHRAGHAISLLGLESEHPVLTGLQASEHLKLTFNDITEPREGFVPPSEQHVSEILEFSMRWPRQRPLLVHCFAGISRSTATAYMIRCSLDPGTDEMTLANRLRTLSPTATPNILMVTIADRLLSRRGRMLSAIKSIGRGVDAFEGTPFVWED